MKHFTSKDGLPGGQVYFTMQDSKGYIWSACEQGVSKFNGYEFESFSIKDGLPSNNVWGIEEDRFGRLWMNTFSGLCYYENGKIKNYNSDLIPDDIDKVSHKITSLGHVIIIESSIEHVFLLNSEDELIRIPDDKYVLFFENIIYKSSKRISNYSYELATNTRDSLLFGTVYCDDYYYHLDSNQLDSILFSIKKQRPRKFLSVSNDRLLFYSFDYIWMFFKGKLSRINLSFCKSEQDKITYIEKIAPNKIWFKIDDKNYIVDSLLRPINKYDFLRDISVNFITEDRQGNFWLSSRSGLHFLNRKALLNKTMSLIELSFLDKVKFLTKNSKNEIWGLGAEGYIFRLTDADSLIQVSSKPIGQRVTDMEFDPNDNLWIAGDFLTMLPRETLNHENRPSDVRDDLIRIPGLRGIKRIEFKNTGEIIISRSKAIEIVYSNSNGYTHKRLTPGRYYGIAYEHDGTFWASGNEGVKHFDSNGQNLNLDLFTDHPILNSPTDNITLGAENQLWAAVNSKGLYHLADERIDSIPELEGVLIHSLYVDEAGSLWIASNKGVTKLFNVNLHPFTYDIRNFTNSEGLASINVKDLIVYDSSIYAATDNGICILQDTIWASSQDTESLYFESVVVNGSNISIDNPINLTYSQNNILIKFVCLDYNDMQTLTYEYKLLDSGDAWIETKTNEKEFSSLSPGNYTFKVRRKLDFPTNEIILNFRINELWWNTTLAKSALLVSLILFTYLIVRSITNRIRMKSEEETLIKTKFAELELNALQAQMNPHFIFNALQSIQDYILLRDPHTANRYLSKFSKLMRLFLESSREKFINLNDEIELLRLYLELEQLRFEDKFQYSITANSNIEGMVIEIPSMLIQPFVENAVNHGLIYKESGGKLDVTFLREDNYLYCRIEDNGIGRKKANEIKSNTTLSYKSRGMQLVLERLKIINIVESQNVEIDVEDLYSLDNISCGTRVIIKMALEV